MILDAGGSTDPRERARLIRFPKVDSGDSIIRLEGDKDVVDKLMSSIQSFVELRQSQMADTVVIPPERHGLLIGRRGETRKGLESEFNVSILIPSTTVTGPERSAIRVSGLPANVEKAKARILATVKEQEGETIMVPRRLHHAIADTNNGNFFRNMNRNLHVSVDHAGQQRPPRPDIQPPLPSNAVKASMPLITDATIDTSALDPHEHHTWTVVNHVTATGDDDPTIPWVLKGSDAEKLAEARRQLESAMAAAEQSRTGFLVLPDPSMCRYVIGPAGSTVNKIRKDTGCKIDVPKQGDGTEAIEIKGTSEAIEQARQLILEAITRSGRQ